MHNLPKPDLAKAMREEVRWRILVAADFGRPYPVTEQIIWHTLSDIKLLVTPLELRQELDYLDKRQLIDINGRDTPIWSATLTRDGIDVVEYTVPCDPGIARPPR